MTQLPLILTAVLAAGPVLAQPMGEFNPDPAAAQDQPVPEVQGAPAAKVPWQAPPDKYITEFKELDTKIHVYVFQNDHKETGIKKGDLGLAITAELSTKILGLSQYPDILTLRVQLGDDVKANLILQNAVDADYDNNVAANPKHLDPILFDENDPHGAKVFWHGLDSSKTYKVRLLFSVKPGARDVADLQRMLSKQGLNAVSIRSYHYKPKTP